LYGLSPSVRGDRTKPITNNDLISLSHQTMVHLCICASNALYILIHFHTFKHACLHPQIDL
uniref:Uncharacterized protein n=1 Tax=Dicentrarchus labrax TaxID=13489 RepID=A0A8C4HNM3_DICLA